MPLVQALRQLSQENYKLKTKAECGGVHTHQINITEAQVQMIFT